MSGRVEVVKVYRRLIRVCQRVFKEDPTNYNAARVKIKSEVMLKKDVTDNDELKHLFKFGHEVADYTSKYVVQLVQTKPDTLRLQLRKENKLIDSPPLPINMKKPSTAI